MSCFVCPSNSTVAVIEQCGQFKRIARPGFNCLDVRCETKTKDNVFVKMQVTVQYQVVNESIYDAFYRLTNPKAQITAYVFDVVRAIVPKSNLDDVFLTKEEIALAVKEELTKSMAAFGFMIIQTLVTDIEPDHKVKDAMNEINSAQRYRYAALEKAEANKVTLVKKAEMKAEAAYLQGQGIARQRQAIVNGLRESVLNFEDGVKAVSPQEVIELMMVVSFAYSQSEKVHNAWVVHSLNSFLISRTPGYMIPSSLADFDLLKDVGTHGTNSTVFLNHNPGTVGDISSQIRNGFMEANANNQVGGNRAIQGMVR